MSEPVGIDPCVDIVFRKLFADPANEPVLVDFLNAVLAGESRVTSARVLNPFVLGEVLDQRTVVVDVLAMDESGRRFLIEMQRWLEASLRQRMVYGAVRTYADTLGKGSPYTALRPALAIWLCERDVFPGDGAHLTFRMREDRSGTVLTEDLRVDVLQLSRWGRERETLLAGDLGRWYGFFNEAAGWPEVPEPLRHPALERAMDVLKDFRHGELDHLYRARVHAERLEEERAAALAAAEAGRDESLHLLAEQRRINADQAQRMDEQARAMAEQQRALDVERARTRELEARLSALERAEGPAE